MSILQSNLCLLPYGCYYKILSYLKYDDYCYLNSTSKNINKILKNIPFKLNLIFYSSHFIKSIWSPLAHIQNKSRFYFGETVHLVNNESYYPIEKLALFYTEYFKDSLRYIKRLYFIDDYIDLSREGEKYNNTKINKNTHIGERWNKFVSSKHPRFSGCVMDYDTSIGHLILNIPHLETLEIHIDLHVSIQDNCKDKDKDCEYGCNDNDNVLNENNNYNGICLFNYLPSTLKILNLTSISNMSDQHMEIITKQCPNLEKLYLSYSEITDKSIERLYTSCKQLIICNLYGCMKITDEGMNFLGKISTLRKVNLDWCNKITDIGIKYLVQHNPYLTHLSLKCTCIGKDSIEYMQKYLFKPMFIDVSYAYNMQFVDISRLKKKCKLVLNAKI